MEHVIIPREHLLSLATEAARQADFYEQRARKHPNSDAGTTAAYWSAIELITRDARQKGCGLRIALQPAGGGCK